ncbi:hypothetical protein B0H14DRAFT_3146880 [Mycena olivaceomarginata]|nr:hypothetical protein B0H14DRAFT_3146880 [Mycena olivaceomarginata]
MSTYSTLHADRRSLPYFPEDRAYYSTSSRLAQWTPDHRGRSITYQHPPPLSIRGMLIILALRSPIILPRPTGLYHLRPISNHPAALQQLHPASSTAVSTYTPPFTRPASRTPVSDAYSTPYADTNTTSPESSASAPPTAVKEEQPDDDGFIMDLPFAPLQMLAPPTEVPLRATQASARMRRMMGVFRLNPFAMHARGGPRRPRRPGPAARHARSTRHRRSSSSSWSLRPRNPPKVEEPGYSSLDATHLRAAENPPKVEAPECSSLDAAHLRAFATHLRAFSPDFKLDASQQHHEPESNWELGYSSMPSFDPVSAYPRALHPRQTEPRPPPRPYFSSGSDFLV